MSNPGQQPEQPDQQRWAQPPFQPAEEPDRAEQLEPVVGQVLLPADAAPPPSVVESASRVLGHVVWPVMIALAIFGVIGWMPAILTAIVVGAVLDQVARELRRRRKAPYQLPPARPGEPR